MGKGRGKKRKKEFKSREEGKEVLKEGNEKLWKK